MPNSPLDGTTTLTFDCYGTIIDWESGAIGAIRPLLEHNGVVLSDDEIITAMQEIEAPLCRQPYTSYREVLARVIDGLGIRFGFEVPPGQRDVLTQSIPSWRPFPDTVPALRALSARHHLAIISNIDDDLLSSSTQKLGDVFAAAITAEQARCYKPDSKIFQFALDRLGTPPGKVTHVAEGADEIPVARRLGCATVWVRRNGRSARFLSEAPDLEVPDPRRPASLVRRQRHRLARLDHAHVVLQRLGHPVGMACKNVVGPRIHPVINLHALLGVQLVHQLAHRRLGHQFVRIAMQHQSAARAGRQEPEIIMAGRRRHTDPAGNLRPPHQQLHAHEPAKRLPGDP